MNKDILQDFSLKDTFTFSVPIGISDLLDSLPRFVLEAEHISSAMCYIDAVIHSIPAYYAYADKTECYIYYDYLQEHLFQNFTPQIVSENYDEIWDCATLISDIYKPWVIDILNSKGKDYYEYFLVKYLRPRNTIITAYPQ